LSAAVASLGVVVLIGWLLGNETLKRLLPGAVAMKANTAIGLMVCALALALLCREKTTGGLRYGVVALALMPFGLGLASLYQYLPGKELGFDQWLFRDVVAPDAPHPGRLAAVTALCFLLWGLAALAAALPVSMGWRVPVVAALATTVALAGALSLVGYLSRAWLGLAWWNYGGVAVHTAAAFVALGGGLIAWVHADGHLPWSIEKTTTVGFAAGVVLMLVAAASSDALTRGSLASVDKITQTQEALKEIQEARAALLGLEEIQATYLQTSPARAAARVAYQEESIRRGLGEIGALTGDSPFQQGRLAQMESLLAQWVEWAKAAIAGRGEAGLLPGAPAVEAARGGALTRGMRELLSAAEREEYVRLQERQTASRLQIEETFLLTPLGFYISMALLFIGLAFLNFGAHERSRFQRAQQEDRARLGGVVDSAMDAIISVDAKQRIVLFNAAAEAMFRCAAVTAMGQPLDRFIPARFRERHRVDIENFGATGMTSRSMGALGSLSGLRADGEEFPIEASISQVEVSGERLFTVILRDITERQRTNDELRESQSRTRLLISASEVGLWDWNLVTSEVYFSPEWKQQLGHTDEDLANLYEEWETRLHPEDLQTTLAAVDDYIDGRVPEFDLEYRLRHKDGTWRCILARATLLRDGAGIPMRIMGCHVDITDRRRAEDALRESEEKYRTLFDQNPHPMYVCEADTLAFVAVNEAAVRHYGFSASEFLGMTIRDIRPPEEVPALLQALRNPGSGKPAPKEAGGIFKHRKKDGTMVEMEVAANRLTFLGRQCWLVHAMDITERRSLEAQLIQAQKLESVGRLAGGVAHDFNNILGIILGSAELCRKRVGEDPRLLKNLDNILNAAERGSGLTRQLLAFSRRQVLQPRVLDLNQVILELQKMLGRLLGEDIALTTALDSATPAVRADAGQLDLVLMNLVVNARDAMPAGGALTIETRSVEVDERFAAAHVGVAPGRYALVAVSDNGHGMSREVREQIFEPFFTTKAPGKGTGLGLATVHGIVKQSGGHVTVYSEVGRGSTFKVFLPAVAEAPEAAPISIGAVPGGVETVLVVEDEQALREIIVESLSSLGYRVVSAANAEAALKTSETLAGPIHLMITDVIMPGMGGSELARRVASRRPDTRVLYMSGFTDDSALLNGILAEDMPFLEKPFTIQAMAARVREVIDQR
jgi:PAS domain S-box-containing protein